MKNLKIKKNNIGKNNPRFLDNQIREKKCAHCHRTMSWWVEFRHLPISIFVKKICCSYQCSNTLNKLIENRKDKNKKNRIKKCEGCGKEMDWSVGYRKKAISEFIKMKFCTKKCADKNGLRYIGKDHPNFRKFSRRKLPQKKRSVWFRREVLKRDKNVCQKCLKKERKNRPVVAHHIKTVKDYPELRFEISNGLTICVPCHAIIHNYKKKKKTNNLKAAG
jgi:hypothetical protein